MTSVFYRSANDGWRIGVAEAFENVTTVVVTDAATKLTEHVKPSDIFLPSGAKGSDKGSAVDALFHMVDHPTEFLDKDDATAMHPPVQDLPPLVALLRHRFLSGKNRVFLGDNFQIELARQLTSPTGSQDSGSQQANASRISLASRVVAALRSATASSNQEKDQNSVPGQLLIGFGANGFPTIAQTGVSMAEELGASPLEVKRIRAASTILHVFTHGIHGEARALSTLAIHTKNDGEASRQFSHAQFNVSLFDTEYIANAAEAPFFSLAFAAYAFDNEEKERCYLPKRGGKFLAINEIHDADMLATIRERYFAFTKAMEEIGFEVNVLLSVSARLAAVLHLLNVEFTDEGTPMSMSAIKHAARLIQTDFNDFQRLLSAPDSYKCAAKILYYSTFLYLTRKVNELLNPNGVESKASITVVALPQQSIPGAGGFTGLRSLVINALYEDLFQAFYRTADKEILQWQEQGFKIPVGADLMFDHLDNFGILKVLKAKGAAIPTLLAAANKSLTQEAMVQALKSLGHHKNCSYDEQSLTLTIHHSFGAVNYAVPRDEHDWRMLRSLFHPDFAEIRNHLMQNTDVETQEAVCMLEQEDESQKAECIVSQLWRDLSAHFLDVLSADYQGLWFNASIAAEGKFRGEPIATALVRSLAPAAVELRRHLPRRFIPVEFTFIPKHFANLLPKGYIQHPDSTIDIRFRAEAICLASGISHVVGKSALLVQASAIAELSNIKRRFFDAAITKIQTALRTIYSAYVVRRRVSRWTEAVTTIEGQQEEAQALYRWRAENVEKHHVQRLVLQEQEHRERGAIRDSYWVEWVALETERQSQLENLIQTAITEAIAAENTLAIRTINDSHRRAVHEINQRVKERLMRQGARLDHVAREEMTRGRGAKRELEKIEEAHDRILRMRLAQEEAKMDLDGHLREKGLRYKEVLLNRERSRQRLRDELWQRQAKDRAVRQHMDATRDQIALHMRQSLEMDEVERQLAERIRTEVRQRQHAEREAHKKALQDVRSAKEKKMEAVQRTNALKQVREEMLIKAAEEREAQRKRREGYKLLALQNREKIVAERSKEEEIKRQKTLTRTLLKAHNMMLDPALYEQTAKGAKLLPEQSRSRSASRGLPGGLVMTGGKVTYPHLLDDATWKGLATYHTGANDTQRSSASRQRQRSASPRSVLSL